MEKLIEGGSGVTALLAGLMIVLTLHFLMRLVEFLWEAFRKKDEKKDRDLTEVALALQQNSEAVRELRVQIKGFEVELQKLTQLHQHTNKLFAGMKFLSGKRWPVVKKHMEDKL